MCGRYALFRTGELVKRFKTRPPPSKLRDSYNVAPGQMLPVVVEEDQTRAVEFMKWGLVPMWAKDPNIGYRMINARAEGIFEKPAWRGPIRRHRCLVPANGFYEWKVRPGERTKQPFFIHPKDQGLFSFAGIYDIWHNAEGDELLTYAIVTTTPNKEMATLHDRMPVILHPDDWDMWLDPALQGRDALESPLRPYQDDGLEMYEVSTDVNTVKNNEGYLVRPVHA